MHLRAILLGTLLCACGTTYGTGGPLAKTPSVFSTAPDLDLDIIDINPTVLKNSGDHQHDDPDNVEARYYWSAAPDWGPVQKFEPKPNDPPGKATTWQIKTDNEPITAIYRVTTKKHLLFFSRGADIVCYINTLVLSKSTSVDADKDPTILEKDRTVLVSSHHDLSEDKKIEVSCDGFDQIKDIDTKK